MSKVQLHPVFIAALFDQVGGYRKTTYNEAAIAFIQRGASLGNKVVDKLADAVKAHMKAAEATLGRTGDDSGYRTINIVGNLLVQAAVKRLHGQMRAETNTELRRINANRYSLSGAAQDDAPAINADAWATEDVTTEQAATPEELSQKESIDDDHQGREMLDEEQWAERQLTSADIRDQVEALAAIFAAPCLIADQILNSWRADYGQTPALSYLRVPMTNGTFRDSDTIDDALQTLALMDDERAIQNRIRTRMQVAQAGSSWA